MPPKPRQPAPPTDLNAATALLSGFGIDVASLTGSMTGGGAGVSIEDMLQSTLLGTDVRHGLGGSPLVGIMPRWFKANPELAKKISRPGSPGSFDPYMPMPDVSSWQVYTPRPRLKVTGSTNANVAEYAMGNLDTKAGDATQTVAAVSNQPYLWTEDQVAGAIKKFQDAGLTNVVDFNSMQKEWGTLVQRAGAMYSMSSGQRKVTPWDVLDLYKNEMTKAGTLSGPAASPTTVTQRTRSVSTITHGDGWSALQNTLSRMLGRDPSDEETRDFVGRMNHIAAKNPTITTATRSGIGSGHENVTEHTRAGFNGNDILENAYRDAQSDDDYAEFQASTTLYNAALSALGAIGG